MSDLLIVREREDVILNLVGEGKAQLLLAEVRARHPPQGLSTRRAAMQVALCRLIWTPPPTWRHSIRK